MSSSSFKSGGFQEAVDGGLGRIDAGALALLALVGGPGIEAFDGEHEAARGGVGLRAFIGEARLDEAVGYHGAQVIGRLRLHAGGNFFRKKLDE